MRHRQVELVMVYNQLEQVMLSVHNDSGAVAPRTILSIQTIHHHS